MLPQIHQNGALRKGKAITLNYVEIKIVRTRAKTLLKKFSYWVISFYDQTTFSMCDVELSMTGTWSWNGFNTLPDSR